MPDSGGRALNEGRTRSEPEGVSVWFVGTFLFHSVPLLLTKSFRLPPKARSDPAEEKTDPAKTFCDIAKGPRSITERICDISQRSIDLSEAF